MPRETSLVTTTGHDGRSVALTFDDGPTGVTPGAVVLLHDGGGDRSKTVCAVEQVVPGLTAGLALPPSAPAGAGDA